MRQTSIKSIMHPCYALLCGNLLCKHWYNDLRFCKRMRSEMYGNFHINFSCRSNTDRDRERDRVTNWQINLSHYELLLLRRLMYCLIQRLFTAL